MELAKIASPVLGNSAFGQAEATEVVPSLGAGLALAQDHCFLRLQLALLSRRTDTVPHVFLQFDLGHQAFELGVVPGLRFRQIVL
jgi:hypothetical protein